jgi:hypothetical protein
VTVVAKQLEDAERDVVALERKWRAVKMLMVFSALVVLVPVGIWVVQSIQNGAGTGFGGGTLIQGTAVIYHNGALADTLTFAAMVLVDAALVLFYYRLLDGLGDS